MKYRWIRIGTLLGVFIVLVVRISPAVVTAVVAADAVRQPRALVQLSGEGEVSLCYVGCGGEIAPAVNADYEQEVAYLVNQERDALGLPPLKVVGGLTNAARYHAADMGLDDYFEHDTYDRAGGALVRVCSTWARIQAYYTGVRWAENIAAGSGTYSSTPRQVMDSWMSSGGHQGQILSPDNWEIGVGYYAGSGSWDRYWVQNFGRQGDAYPLITNLEAAATESVYVALYIYGDWDEIRLRNDGATWSAWRSFQNRMNWTLNAQDGLRTVQAEMRKAGQSVSSSDSIYLTAPRFGSLADSLVFSYSIPQQRLIASSHSLNTRNEGNQDQLEWSIATLGTWFTVSPLSGTTPDSFRIAPTTFATDKVATYTGEVTITVVDLAGVNGSPQTVDLTLHVVDTVFYDSYLPAILKVY